MKCLIFILTLRIINLCQKFYQTKFLLVIFVSESIKPRMPRNIVVPEEDFQRMEEGGGLSPVTVKDRERHYRYLLEFLSKENDGGEDLDVGKLLESEEGRDELTNLIGRFFFSMRVEA